VQGYQLSFFTQQDRMVQRQTVAQWLLELARANGIAGATLMAAEEGFGHDRKLRSAHFIELADQPIEVTMALSRDEADRIFALLKQHGVDVFYILTPIEYGMSSQR
jgi:PII-like signaling protein